MDRSEPHIPHHPEHETGEPANAEMIPEQTVDIAQKVITEKSALEVWVGSQTGLVEDTFRSLEEDTEISASDATIADPEEVIARVKSGLAIESPGIDEIFRAVSSAGLEAGSVREWQNDHGAKIRSLNAEAEELLGGEDTLSEQLSEKKVGNPLRRLLNWNDRKRLSRALRGTLDRRFELQGSLSEHSTRAERIDAAMDEITVLRESLALRAAEQLFSGIVVKNRHLKDTLTSPEIKRALNDELISREIAPALDVLESRGWINSTDREEYLELLHEELRIGGSVYYGDPPEKHAAIAAWDKRFNELNNKAGGNLRGLDVEINSHVREGADSFYDTIFDLLGREATKEQIEKVCSRLTNQTSPDLSEGIRTAAGDAIYPHRGTGGWGDNHGLDLANLPLDVFQKLNGLERWSVIKHFAAKTGVISMETFTEVEKTIIQRLADEVLLPSGSESHEGSAAVVIMNDLGSPLALPYLLRHLTQNGPSGHTGNQIVHAMEHLLEESDPEELEKVLASLPHNHRMLFGYLADEQSHMNTYGRMYNDRYQVALLLHNADMTIAKEQLTGILSRDGITGDELKDFFLGNIEGTPDFLEVFIKNRREVENIIITSKVASWIESADKLLAALVNPQNGPTADFPKRIATESIGITDEQMLTTIDHIFSSKTFQSSGYEREAFLDGLILLSSKVDGKATLETLLESYRGARNDPTRMRRVFQMLETLDNLGEYGLVTPDEVTTAAIQQEIIDTQNALTQTTYKSDQKVLKNKIQTLTTELHNITGLKGIEDAMTQKLVDVACKKLELSEDFKEKIEANLDKLLRGGLLEIIPTLAGKYELLPEQSTQALLRTITEHVISGDFKTWRYSHEQSKDQFSGLNEEQREFWKSSLTPVTIEITLSDDDQNRRSEELQAAQAIVGNAKAHILEAEPEFDFSPSKLQQLTEEINTLTGSIKSAESDDEKQRLIEKKRRIQAEAHIVEGILEIENATTTSFGSEQIIAQARALREKIAELNLPQAGVDIEQIEKIFTVGDIQRVIAFESDDPVTLFKVGTEPQETCQSWRKGSHNECLLAYVADSNKKVVNVADGEGNIIARSMIKLTNQREKDNPTETNRATLLVEPPYSLLTNTEVYRAFVRLILTKASGIDASVTLGDANNKELVAVFTEEAEAFGFTGSQKELDIFIPRSMNAYEYSDSLGGKITWFDRYHSRNTITFEKNNDAVTEQQESTPLMM